MRSCVSKVVGEITGSTVTNEQGVLVLFVAVGLGMTVTSAEPFTVLPVTAFPSGSPKPAAGSVEKVTGVVNGLE